MKTCAAGMSRIATASRKFVKAGRVLERDGGVRVEEAAAVRAELLDRDLRRGRAARDRLSGPLERVRRRVAAERLHDALGDQDRADDQRERQQDVDE
jgi:hypothetical protein